MKVKKAVIPVAGLGTRFLPYTKALPKEMVPVLDLPAIHFIVQEALSSGIEKILFVTSKGKGSIEEYFTRNRTLEKYLRKYKKYDCLKQVKRVPYDFIKKSVIQKSARGLGDAILHAKSFVFDRKEIFIGSLNLDPRALDHNTEIGIIITSEKISKSIAEWFDNNINQIAFRLELVTNSRGKEFIYWHGIVDGQPQVFDVEPYTGFVRE